MLHEHILNELYPLVDRLNEEVEGIYFLITEMVGRVDIALCYNEESDTIDYYPPFPIGKFHTEVDMMSLIKKLKISDIISHRRDRKIKQILE